MASVVFLSNLGLESRCSFKPRLVEDLIQAKCVEVQRPHVDIVWKFGLPTQISSSSLNSDSKLLDPSPIILVLL
ncbi:hypothetical protein TNCV_2377381 [Trichonephila clavipes]|nr:hypothetical protein TNCV_2377381 [Trichonephila clavipes]